LAPYTVRHDGLHPSPYSQWDAAIRSAVELARTLTGCDWSSGRRWATAIA
jgi:hypothetical protein